MVKETRSLADLRAGHEGWIAGLRLGGDARVEEHSPLQVGARVYVVEATGRGWQHVRIGHREYSVPQRVAEGIIVHAPGIQHAGGVAPDAPAAPSPCGDDLDGAATQRYEVLLTRARRTVWRVLVIERRGTVVRSSLFDDRDSAQAAWAALQAEAESSSTAEFRDRHGLP